MKIAIEAGGFTPGEADQLRRAMATFKRTGTIGNYSKRMIEGMVAQGYDARLRRTLLQADRRVRRIRLSRKPCRRPSRCWSMPPAGSRPIYPDVFCAAILNSQPMGFYAPAQLVRDARDHGVEIRRGRRQSSPTGTARWRRRPSIRRGSPARHAEMRGVIRTRHAVRLGFRQIKGLAEKRHGAVRRSGAAPATIRCAMSGCAPASTSARSSGWPRPTPSARSASTGARPCGRCARSTRQERRRAPAAVRPARDPPARQRAGDQAAGNAARRACHP